MKERTWRISENAELKPCPFCGSQPVMIVKREIRSIIWCTNPQCYLHFNAPTSWHNGDTEEHAYMRLTTWWNRRAEDGKFD